VASSANVFANRSVIWSPVCFDYGNRLLLGGTSIIVYVVLAVVMVLLQYLLSPYLVGLMMKVKYVSEKEEPELHRMVTELAREAGIPKPKVGISQISVPNAFAFAGHKAMPGYVSLRASENSSVKMRCGQCWDMKSLILNTVTWL